MLLKIDRWIRKQAGKALPGLTMFIVMVSPYASEEKKDAAPATSESQKAVAQMKNAFMKGLLFDGEDDAVEDTGVSLPYSIYLAQAQVPGAAAGAEFSKPESKHFLPLEENVQTQGDAEHQMDAEYERLLEAYLNKVEDLILMKEDYAEALQEMDKMMLLAPMHPKVRNLKKVLNKKIKAALEQKRLPDNITLIPSPEKAEKSDRLVSLLKERALLEVERRVLEEKVQETQQAAPAANEAFPYAAPTTQAAMPANAKPQSREPLPSFDSLSGQKKEEHSESEVYLVPMEIYEPEKKTQVVPDKDVPLPDVVAASDEGEISEKKIPHKFPYPEEKSEDLAPSSQAQPDMVAASASPIMASAEPEQFIDFAPDPFVSTAANDSTVATNGQARQISQLVSEKPEPVSAPKDEALRPAFPIQASMVPSPQETKNFVENFISGEPEMAVNEPVPLPNLAEQFILRGKKYFQQQNFSLALISFSKARQSDVEGEYSIEIDDLIRLTKARLDAMHYT